MNAFMRATLAAFFAPMLCLSPLGPSHGFEMGGLTSLIKAGSDGNWRVTYEFGAAVLENQRGQGLVRQYAVQPERRDAGKRSISVDVSVFSNDPSARAGLLYGFSDGSQSYYLFGIGPDGFARIERYANRRMETIKQLDKVNGQPVRLTITEINGESRFSVNGQEKAVLRLEGASTSDGDTTRGGAGIMAFSIGRFGFRNFEIAVNGQKRSTVSQNETEPRPKPKPTPKADTQNANILGQRGLPRGTFRVKPIQIKDVWGIEKGTVKAGSIIIPSGWKFEGEKVTWVHKGCLARTIQSPFNVTSPGEEVIIAKFVTQQVVWTSFPNNTSACPKVRISNADEMTRYLIGLLKLENARLVEKTRIPAMSERLRRFSRRDSVGSIILDHMGFIVDYDHNGQPYRGGMFFISNHNLVAMNDGWGGRFETLVASATPQFLGAPREKFEQYMPVYQMVMNSYRVDPQWQVKVNALFAKMRKEDQQTFDAINKINQQTQKEIAAINQAIYDTKNQASDNAQQDFVQMIREEQTVQTSNGPTVTPVGTVWETKGGDLIVSSNPNFDPSSVGITATRVEPARR